MNFVIENTEIPAGAMWYSSHMKEQADPVYVIVSFQGSLGREVALCPLLKKRAVPSLLVLKNSIVLNTKVIGCHQTEAGINW